MICAYKISSKLMFGLFSFQFLLYHVCKACQAWAYLPRQKFNLLINFFVVVKNTQTETGMNLSLWK